MVDKVNDSMHEEELIKALQDALAAQPDAEPDTITRREYAELRGVSGYTARKHLRQLVDSAVLEPGYIMRINDWGERQRVKGYRYVGNS